jgi:hypothetical protein
MSTPRLGLASPSAGAHPAVVGRRIHDALLLALAGLASVALALAIAVAVPTPNYALVLGALVGVLALGVFAANPRLEITVPLLAFYLGCINGPVKLIVSGGTAVSALQDVLILAICLGILVRRIVSGRKLTLPPLSSWVIAWTAVVVLEAFNPRTLNLLKVGAGFREQLEWVPFFFFGYLLVRSKSRLRRFFLVLGVIALANGVVSTYQTQLGPAAVASWGPGYSNKLLGQNSRVYKSEGVSYVRPTGLGDESGGGGATGLVAIAGLLALLGTSRRRRGALLLLTFGAIAAVATGLGRLEVVGSVLAVIGYALLTASAGRQARGPLRALIVTFAIAVPFLLIFVASVGEGVFSRYSSIAPGKVATTGTSYKEGELKQIPTEIAVSPFGFGLGTAGAAAGFGGSSTEDVEGHNVNAETTFNFIVKEVGLPGLVVWIGFILTLITLAFRRVRLIADSELQVYLAAVFAPVFALFFMGFDGPVSQSEWSGPYIWFAGGIAAYWLVGPGWRLAQRRVSALARQPSAVAAT